MNLKSRYFFALSTLLLGLLVIEFIYLTSAKNQKKEDFKIKNIYKSITGLPDLAISTETIYIRHRSLSDTFSIFKESPVLREYFPTSFIYSHSHILHKTPSKVSYEK